MFSASLRENSLNTRLARLAALTIEANAGDVDRASVREFDLPSYDADAQHDRGFPPGADALRERLEAADAFVVSSLEYNASVPGILERHRLGVAVPSSTVQRTTRVLLGSPSMVGGNLCLWALRIPLEHLGARVYPDMFSLVQAHNAFADDGTTANPQLQERFETNIAKLHGPRRGGEALPLREARVG